MAKQRPLQDGDLEMIAYFHREKGDVTCWCDWDNVQDALLREHPAIVKAHNDYRMASAVLDAVIKGIS
jgi:hypothetical protein